MSIQDKVQPADVLAAADTLEAISRLYDYMNPSFGMWSAEDLRNEIPHIKARISEELLLDGLVEKIAKESDPILIKEILRGYEISAAADIFSSDG